MTGPIRASGVWTQDAVAPNEATLRPLNRGSGAFPVFPQLQEQLLTPSRPLDTRTQHPDWTVAQVLATCAGYAYSDAETVTTMMARMGLLDNRCRMIGEYVDAMLIQSTAFVVQSKDGKVVILAYRGTQPANLINWLANIDIHPDKVQLTFDDEPGGYGVHAGFYRNTRATRFRVAEALRDALEGRPVTTTLPAADNDTIQPMEALYVTGHSLGAAMGAIFSVLMKAEKSYWADFGGAFRAAYLFGEPMVGDVQLAEKCNSDSDLKEKIVRFIYQKDPVPHLPPQETGTFQNFGQEYRFADKKRGWRCQQQGDQAKQMWRAAELYGATAAGLMRQVPTLGWASKLMPYQIDDHDPQHYIRALTPPGTMTEFGDYDYL